MGLQNYEFDTCFCRHIFREALQLNVCHAQLFGLWCHFHWLHFLSFVIHALVDQFFVFGHAFTRVRNAGTEFELVSQL